MSESASDRPSYRIVDRMNRGWIFQGTAGDAATPIYQGFDPSSTRKIFDARPLAQIEAEFGPVRPVEEVPAEDAAELRAALAAAGRKGVGSLASALELLHYEARERARVPGGEQYYGAEFGYAERTLIAGRPGSWEAERLGQVVLFGNDLNLHPRPKGRSAVADPEEMRKTGPNRKRVDVEARDRMAAVLRGWVDSPDRFTEVAENLAELVSRYADETHGPEGWRQIADQWLQPGGMAQEDIYACYTLLYSLSQYFDPSAC